MLCRHGLADIYILEGRVGIKELKYGALSAVEAGYKALDKFLGAIQNYLSFISGGLYLYLTLNGIIILLE